MSLIELKDIHKSFMELKFLHGVNFVLQAELFVHWWVKMVQENQRWWKWLQEFILLILEEFFLMVKK